MALKEVLRLIRMLRGSSPASIDLYLSGTEDKRTVLILFQAGVSERYLSSSQRRDKLASLPLFVRNTWYIDQRVGSTKDSVAWLVQLAPKCTRADIDRCVDSNSTINGISHTSIVSPHLWAIYPDSAASFSMNLDRNHVLEDDTELHTLHTWLGIQQPSYQYIVTNWFREHFEELTTDDQIETLRVVKNNLPQMTSHLPFCNLLRSVEFICPADSTATKRKPSTFLNPGNALFCAVLPADSLLFPAHPFSKSSWVSFLQPMGLIVQVTVTEVLMLAQQVERLKDTDRAHELMKHVFCHKELLVPVEHALGALHPTKSERNSYPYAASQLLKVRCVPTNVVGVLALLGEVTFACDLPLVGDNYVHILSDALVPYFTPNVQQFILGHRVSPPPLEVVCNHLVILTRTFSGNPEAPLSFDSTTQLLQSLRPIYKFLDESSLSKAVSYTHRDHLLGTSWNDELINLLRGRACIFVKGIGFIEASDVLFKAGPSFASTYSFCRYLAPAIP